MAERSGSRGSGWRKREAPVNYDNRSIGRVPEDNWQQDYIIPLCSVSAKTRLSPPMTYWEKSSDTGVPRGGVDSRQNSVWRNVKFTLNLRTTKVNHFRFLNLHCEPLPPLGYSPDRMSLSLSLEPGREEVMLTRYGKAHGGNSVDLRLFSAGRCQKYTSNSRTGSSYRWTAILNNLQDALHQADGIMDLRLLLEKEDDMEMLQSFLEAAALDNRAASSSRRNFDMPAPHETKFMRLDQGPDTQPIQSVIPKHRPTIIENRPLRPQTNPNLDPRIYDPFPGIPVKLARPGSHEATENRSSRTNDMGLSSESPAGTSQMLAAMELSDGGVAEESTIGASLGGHGDEDTVPTPSSSEEWSFLQKKSGRATTSSSSSSSSVLSLSAEVPVVSPSRGRKPVMVSSSPSNTSPSSPSPSPSPAPAPSPPRRRGPVVVKSESESSDVEVIRTRKAISSKGKKKKKRSKSVQLESGEEKKEVKVKRKKKKRKQKEVMEPVDEAPAQIKEEDDEEMVDEVEEELVNSDIERLRRRQERKKRRKAKELSNGKDVDNDGDVDMQAHDNGISKKRTKRKKQKGMDSGLDLEPSVSDIGPKKRKKSKRTKETEQSPQSESGEPPLLPTKSSKRKRGDLFASNAEDSESLGEDGGDTTSLKKRLLEINLAKYELHVEERELRAKLLRTQFNARKQKPDDGRRFSNFTCSACGEYGHRRDSRACEMHPSRAER